MSFRIFRLLIAIVLLGSTSSYGQGLPPKLSLKGRVLILDASREIGDLSVTIDGNKLQGSASYPARLDQKHVTITDSFEGEFDKDRLIEGKATRKYREAIIEVGAKGSERTLAYVEYQEIGRFQGRYKDGALEVEGRFFKLDRNARYEMVDAAKAKLPVEQYRKLFEARVDVLTLFKWDFSKKQK